MRTPSLVIHLIHRPQRRGAELFALDLAEHLPPELGGTIYSLYRGADGDGFHSDRLIELEAGGGPVEKLTGLDWSAYFALDRAINARRTRLIVAHGGSTLKYAGALGLTHPGCAVVYRCIGMPSYWAKSPIVAGVNRVLLKHADAVVCTCEAASRDLQSHYGVPEERIHVIDNGLDMRRCDVPDDRSGRTAMRDSLGIPPEATVLVNVGSLTAEKGQADLIDVLHRLRREGIDARLVIVGAGPLRTELEALAVAAGLERYVHLLGEQGDVAGVLKASDMFLLSSRTEGMPAAVIEAGICGLPVVAYAVGGIAEMIEDGVDGMTVPAGEAPALAASAGRVAADPALARRIGREASQRWRGRYDIRVVADRYRALFERLLEERVAAQRP